MIQNETRFECKGKGCGKKFTAPCGPFQPQKDICCTYCGSKKFDFEFYNSIKNIIAA
jgi:DNA-directed RNA polymerase subunit RPC12/RpoP